MQPVQRLTQIGTSKYNWWTIKNQLEGHNKLKILTDTISVRYPGRKLPRLIILCSESLVGSESSLTSTLSNAQMLSKGGLSNCKNKQSLVGWTCLLEFQKE